MANLDPENVRKAQNALDKVARVWSSLPGVISVEVARRWKDGAPRDELGIRVTVEDPAFVRDGLGEREQRVVLDMSPRTGGASR